MRLPAWVITEIDKIRRRFLWKGAAQESKGYNLVDWDTVCQPKQTGGLGILDIKIFSQSLLLKWLWMWTKSEHKIWKPLLEATAPVQQGIPVAHLFNQIQDETFAFFFASVQFIPGDGTKICFWHHRWGHGILKHTVPDMYSYSLDTDISLRGMATGEDIHAKFRPNMSLEAHSELQTITARLSELVLYQGQRDEPRWKWTGHGEFTVQSAYRTLKSGPLEGNHIRRIRRLKAPSRMLVFGWLSHRNKILTHDNLKKRGLQIVSRCTLCKSDSETVRHLLQHCQYTKLVYSALRLLRPSYTWLPAPVLDITDNTATGRLTNEQKGMLLIMQFVIWRERCARVSTEKEKQPLELAHQILQQVHWLEIKINTRGTNPRENTS